MKNLIKSMTACLAISASWSSALASEPAVIMAGVVDIEVPGGARLQDGCEFWIASEHEHQDPSNWQMSCIELPADGLDSIGRELAARLAQDWEIADAMGFATVYQSRDEQRCPGGFVVSVQSKEAVTDPIDRLEMQTAAIVFMLPRNYEEFCV